MVFKKQKKNKKPVGKRSIASGKIFDYEKNQQKQICFGQFSTFQIRWVQIKNFNQENFARSSQKNN